MATRSSGNDGPGDGSSVGAGVSSTTRTLYPLRAEETTEMGETSLADIVLKRLDAVDQKLDEMSRAMLKQQGETALDLQAIRRDVRELQDWRHLHEQEPAQRLQAQAARASIWSQHWTTYVSVAGVAVMIAAQILVPIFHDHWR